MLLLLPSNMVGLQSKLLFFNIIQFVSEERSDANRGKEWGGATVILALSICVDGHLFAPS